VEPEQLSVVTASFMVHCTFSRYAIFIM